MGTKDSVHERIVLQCFKASPSEGRLESELWLEILASCFQDFVLHNFPTLRAPPGDMRVWISAMGKIWEDVA